MGARTWIPLVAIATVVVAAGASIAQDGASSVEVEIDHVPGTTDEAYRADATVKIQNPQGVSLARESTVTLSLGDDWLERATFDPASYTVNWAEHYAESLPETRHTRTVELAFQVPESYAEGDRKTILVQVDVENDPGVQGTASSQAAVAVPFPGDEPAGEEATIETQGEDSGGSEEANASPAAGPGVIVLATVAGGGWLARWGTRRRR